MEEETIFAGYFGNTPAVRILDFLIIGKDFDYSMTEIAEGAGVGWTSFTRIWKELEEKKVVIRTREIGRAKLYKLNIEDPTIQQLVRLHWEIIKSETDKLFKEKGWDEREISKKEISGVSKDKLYQQLEQQKIKVAIPA